MPRHTQQATASGKRDKETLAADAVQMLEQDHRAVERLFNEFASGDQGRKADLAQQIFQELEIHATLEEELFYPVLRSQQDLGDLAQLEQGDSEIDGADRPEQDDLDEDDDEAEGLGEEMAEVIDSAYEDHQAVKALIGRLRSLSSGAPEFQSGMAELKELVTDHVAEEEEVLFSEAKLRLDTKVLGSQMQERKQELLQLMA
ncbi:MAG: hemerythrin domain-containing protein [Nitrospira sp.]